MAKREMKKRDVEETKVDLTEPATEENVVETTKNDVESVTKGVVVDCSKLNIRKAPKMDADIVAIIDAGATLTIIDEGKHAGEWYKVVTDKKVNGFCMKKYVKIG